MAILDDVTTQIASPVTESASLDFKPKFVPKRRTPYLMQEEVIKQKENAQAFNKDINKGSFTDPLVPINNSSQLDDKKQSISSQFDSNLSSENPRDNTLITSEKNKKIIKTTVIKGRSDNEIDQNRESDSSLSSVLLNFHEEVPRLYGIQKKLAHYFAQNCIQRRQNKTGPVTAETLCHITGSTKKTIKKIIQRMIEKGLIKRIIGKRGKGGFSTFELEQEFIDVMRLQIDLELNHIAKHVQFDNIVPDNSINKLPEDWEKIDLTALTDAFRHLKTKSTQVFGKAQLKTIYIMAGTKLTSTEVQKTINAFSYGLKNYSMEEPYKTMISPAAILLETLKNGEQWEERKYLSVEEEALYSVYRNISKNVEENIRYYYLKWKKIDTDTKYAYYKSKLRSNEYYDDKVFDREAWDDYEKNLWSKEKASIILDMMGNSNESLLAKFELINK